MSFYQQNRNNFRGNQKRNSAEGQTGVKRKNPRWTNRQKTSNNFNIDEPLFKTPYLPNRSSNSSSHKSSYDDDSYHYDNEGYNDDRYNGPSFNQRDQRNSPSPARSMRGGHRSTQQRTPTSETRSKQFVDPQHSGPSWQWDTYFNECLNWQDKHKLAYFKSRCMSLEFENQMLFEQIKTLIHENTVIASERGEVPSMLLPYFPGGLRGFEGGNDSATGKDKGKNTKTSDDTSADESLVFDVPDTMIAVIEKSMRHKLKLYQERKEEAAKEKAEDEKNKEEELKKRGTVGPRGFKRKEELEKLYGGNATLIQSLETSVQHSFNRNCDTHKPEMWMTVPLNPAGAV